MKNNFGFLASVLLLDNSHQFHSTFFLLTRHKAQIRIKLYSHKFFANSIVLKYFSFIDKNMPEKFGCQYLT